jgi:arginase family enzyme
MVHFDAHHDSYGKDDTGEMYLGNLEWAGAWARIMCEENLVDPNKVFQIGIRGHHFVMDEGVYSKKAGYRIIEKAEFDTMGVPAVVKEIRDRIGDTPTYITFDLDVANIEAGYPGVRRQSVSDSLRTSR